MDETVLDSNLQGPHPWEWFLLFFLTQANHPTEQLPLRNLYPPSMSTIILPIPVWFLPGLATAFGPVLVSLETTLILELMLAAPLCWVTVVRVSSNLALLIPGYTCPTISI